MAAVLLSKPAEAVTQEEVADAVADYVVKGDPGLTWRAVRAGVRAAVLELEPDLFPEALAGELVGALRALDEGDARGLATPAKTTRRKSPSRRAEIERALAAEVAFQQGKHHIGRDEALEIVTGVSRGAKRPTAAAGLPPILAMAETFQTLRRLAEQGNRDNSGLTVAARAEGEAERRGEALSPNFKAFREKNVALFRARWAARGRRSARPK
jgi:hypothetical protein